MDLRRNQLTADECSKDAETCETLTNH